MFETLGFEETTPLAVSVLLGLLLGGVYGGLAQRSAFCLRRSLVGRWRDCLPALGAWAMALAMAIAGPGWRWRPASFPSRRTGFSRLTFLWRPPSSAGRFSARAWCWPEAASRV